jgi:NAD(P)-dependent dehydrogenase (short-subunit alcohol dehydrogenase family)
MEKVWLITGASKGFGRVWARAAVERGDSVAATARDASSLVDLVATHGERVLPLELDVNDKAAIDLSVAAAHERFGRLDVVVNNAGYGQFGGLRRSLRTTRGGRSRPTSSARCGLRKPYSQYSANNARDTSCRSPR